MVNPSDSEGLSILKEIFPDASQEELEEKFSKVYSVPNTTSTADTDEEEEEDDVKEDSVADNKEGVKEVALDDEDTVELNPRRLDLGPDVNALHEKILKAHINFDQSPNNNDVDISTPFTINDIETLVFSRDLYVGLGNAITVSKWLCLCQFISMSRWYTNLHHFIISTS